MVFLTVFTVLLLQSCKTTSTTAVDKSVIDKDEKVSTETVRDSVATGTITLSSTSDSVSTVRTEDTEIIFASGGGKYNAKTGDAEGVATVRTNAREEQLRKRLEEAETLQRSYSGRIETLRDSIAELRQRNDILETRTEKADTWWRWLLGGMAGGAAIIISLKKIPYTKPIMFWL